MLSSALVQTLVFSDLDRRRVALADPAAQLIANNRRPPFAEPEPVLQPRQRGIYLVEGFPTVEIEYETGAVDVCSAESRHHLVRGRGRFEQLCSGTNGPWAEDSR